MPRSAFTCYEGHLASRTFSQVPAHSSGLDDPNLVSAAGLIAVVKFAQDAGLSGLADQLLSVPGDQGAHAERKVMSLVAGMVAGGDSIDDMALLRQGGMGKVFDRPYAPSTLGSLLRAFAFGHVRQLDAVASRFLTALGASTPVVAGSSGQVLVDVDDTIIEVHGYAKQGSGYGYSGVRGLNALLATVTGDQGAPLIVAQRLRKGSAGSPRGAARLSPTPSPPYVSSGCSTRPGQLGRCCFGLTQRSTGTQQSPPPSAQARTYP